MPDHSKSRAPYGVRTSGPSCGTWLTASTPPVSFRHRVVGSKPVGVRSRQLISLIKAAICLAPSPATRRFSAIPTLLSSIVLVLAVGFSRVVLGVHYPSDILAGWALAISWAQRSWSPRGC